MSALDKLERKLKGRCIPHITRIFVICSILGDLLYMQNTASVGYFAFSPHLIMQGQVWRLITWIFMPSGNTSSFWGLLFIFCLWMLGESLENSLGSFKMNFFFFGSIIFFDIVGMLFFGITCLAPINGSIIEIWLTMSYSLFSLYLMLGLFMPDAEVRLYFVLPIKMKWLVIVYFVDFAYKIYACFKLGLVYGIMMGTVIILTLIFLLVFVALCKRKVSHSQRKRQRQYQANFSQPRPGSGIARNKCCICGRTEITNPELTFRYCSKCTGGKQYCNDHLFTHTHS